MKTYCHNLRYSCPRCNSYKRDNWITIKDGCIRDCEKCQTKICTTDIYRFINCLHENPTDYLELNDSCELISIQGSKPAEYTIQYLRLNRTQLVKLRRVRRFVKLWKQELLQSQINAQENILRIIEQINDFNLLYSNNYENHTSKESLLLELSKMQFDMLLDQAKHFKELIENELSNLEFIEGKRLGSDSIN